MAPLRLAIAFMLLTAAPLTHADAEVTDICISGRVNIGASIVNAIRPGATLYVYARDIDRDIGPPIVVKTITGPTYPQSFTLCPSDTMIPGHRSEPLVGRYRLFARHSPSGIPMKHEGFLGSTIGNRHKGIVAGDHVEILIDRALAPVDNPG